MQTLFQLSMRRILWVFTLWIGPMHWLRWRSAAGGNLSRIGTKIMCWSSRERRTPPVVSSFSRTAILYRGSRWAKWQRILWRRCLSTSIRNVGRKLLIWTSTVHQHWPSVRESSRRFGLELEEIFRLYFVCFWCTLQPQIVDYIPTRPVASSRHQVGDRRNTRGG